MLKFIVCILILKPYLKSIRLLNCPAISREFRDRCVRAELTKRATSSAGLSKKYASLRLKFQISTCERAYSLRAVWPVEEVAKRELKGVTRNKYCC
jgi:hypothetical protein